MVCGMHNGLWLSSLEYWGQQWQGEWLIQYRCEINPSRKHTYALCDIIWTQKFCAGSVFTVATKLVKEVHKLMVPPSSQTDGPTKSGAYTSRRPQHYLCHNHPVGNIHNYLDTQCPHTCQNDRHRSQEIIHTIDSYLTPNTNKAIQDSGRPYTKIGYTKCITQTAYTSPMSSILPGTGWLLMPRRMSTRAKMTCHYPAELGESVRLITPEL